MDLLENDASRLRFEAYIEQLASIIGHADRTVPLHDYCTGLVLPGERKSVEPMAALTAPAATAAKHQSLLHFVAIAPWSDEAVLSKVRQMALPKIEALGAIEASIIDDTGFPKKGRHSVGVARQYCGQLGKQDNCQAVVSLSVANRHASLPVAHRLYLPEAWANDPDRRKQAKVPEDIVFKTKPQIALDQLRAAHAAGIPLATVLADSGYGYDGQFREGVTQLGLCYAVGIQSNVLLWKADASLPVQGPQRQKPSRPQLRAQQISAKELALSQAAEAWQKVTWREHGEAFTSRFGRWRVRPVTPSEQPAEEWLVIEWPKDEDEPTKYWLSTLPADIGFEALVDRTKLRWRIERDYQDLKQELGLGHYEGRGWRGLHHHITLCIAAYGFLIAERAIFPPGGRKHARSTTVGVSAGDRSEGAAAASRAPCCELDHHPETAAYCRSGQASAAVPVLRRTTRYRCATQLVTQ
jgi:SRSO17 transposase